MKNKIINFEEIKIDESFLDTKNDLIREATILSSCNHLNIVKLYGVCYEKTILKYLIMEYMNMGDLRSYLIKNRTNKVQIIIPILFMYL